jgi:hypothetical protein
MSRNTASFGLVLSNRGVMIGATTIQEMVQMAQQVDETDVRDSVWVGDSILAKPRVDALVLLAALAGQTRRVRIGAACFASTPLKTIHESFSKPTGWPLDRLSNAPIACET